ncbi:hypothetical protein LguiA_026526 [Lonicera macranthoides]
MECDAVAAPQRYYSEAFPGLGKKDQAADPLHCCIGFSHFGSEYSDPCFQKSLV